MRRLFGLTSLGLAGPRVAPARSVPRRFCATVPSEDEVVKAYGVLGVTLSSAYTDVKKRYLSLAKEHHPDVSASTAAPSGGTNRMVDINHAYGVVTRFHKAGRTLSAARTSHAAGSSGTHRSGSGGQHNWTNARKGQSPHSAYRPWHEDVDPLLYEMMWEEMRRQNEEETFAHSMPNSDAFDDPWNQAYPFYAQYQQQGPPQPRRWKSSNNNNHNNNASKNQKQQQQQSASKPVKTTTWPEADLKALINMYQDGKSFDFIANALGKETGSAIEEFNRWSDDSKKNRQQHHHKNNNQKNSRRRQPGFHDGPYYYTESPDDDDIPFEFHDMMMGGPDGMYAEDVTSDPYGYYDEDDLYGGDTPNGGPMPFTGAHYMHGAPQHIHKPQNNQRGPKHRNQGPNQQRRNKKKHHNRSSNRP